MIWTPFFRSTVTESSIVNLVIFLLRFHRISRVPRRLAESTRLLADQGQSISCAIRASSAAVAVSLVPF